MRPRPGLDPASLVGRVAALDEQGALEAVRARVAGGDDAMAIIADCQRGLQLVGEDYASSVYFISGLIMAGEIFREAMEILEPLLPAAGERASVEAPGGVLICTVRGDIHDLGKNIVIMMLRSHGIVVHDLGVDVSPDEVVRKALALQPAVLGLSGLLTAAAEGMKATVAAVRDAGDQIRALPIIIGGSIVSEEACAWTGADLWANDASRGVRLIREAIAAKRG